LAMLEKAVSRIERTRGTALSGTSTNGYRHKSLEFFVNPIFHFLRALANGLTFDYFDPPSTQTSPKTLAFTGPRPSLHHAKTPNWHGLETIEEDAMEQPNTNQQSFGQSDNEAPLTSCQSDPDDVGVSRRSHRLGQSPRKMTNAIANVVSLPYRLAVGIIVAISPPLQHFFH